jgi:hypothetical protein
MEKTKKNIHSDKSRKVERSILFGLTNDKYSLETAFLPVMHVRFAIFAGL